MSKQHSGFAPKLLNGAIAGSVGTCCIFPLDLAKTRLQNQRTVSKVGEQVTRLYKNVFHCVYVVAKTEGVRGLYKGLGINLLLVNPEKAIKLAVNDQARQMMGATKGKFLPIPKETFAGAIAGLCQVIVTTPMELLKIQLQVAGKGGEQASGIAVGMKLIREKGIVGVYKGTGATIMRDVPFSCIYFPLFAYLNGKGFSEDGTPPHLLHSMGCGLFAGMFGSGMVTPLDVIKTRLQTLKKVEGAPTYNGFVDCAVKIFKNEGVPAFYKGAVPRMITVAPLFGIAQMVYFIGIAEYIIDTASSKLSPKNKYE